MITTSLLTRLLYQFKLGVYLNLFLKNVNKVYSFETFLQLFRIKLSLNFQIEIFNDDYKIDFQIIVKF